MTFVMTYVKLATVVLALAVAAGAVGQAAAQGPDTKGKPAVTKPSKDQGSPRQTVQGKIAEVDANVSRLTLEDGTVLMLRPEVKVSRELLKKGALIQARYEETGGQKVVRGITGQPRS